MSSFGQTFTITDAFADRSKFIDLSLLETWGPAPLANGRTAFQLANKTAGGTTLPALALTSEAFGYSGITGADQLKTMSAIDYVFPMEIDRRSTTVEIVFDAVWDQIGTGGENGRFIVTLMNDYPPGGPVTGDINNVSDPMAFGRPIYNVRIRNNSTTANPSLILFGAANNNPTPLWEKDGTGTQWLPGFSQQSCFGAPGSACNPVLSTIATNTATNTYPNTGTRRGTGVITSTTAWRTYRILFEPYRISLFSRLASVPRGTAWTVSDRDNFMEIPDDADPQAINKINAAHGSNATQLPHFYDWFQFAEAVRLYWRAGGGTTPPLNNAWIANLEINATQDPLLNLQLTDWRISRQPGGNHLLSWKSEDKNSFDVQHSRDGRVFRTLASRVLPSDGNQSYSFLHLQPGTGSHYYRLQATNSEGKLEYSSTLVIQGTNQPMLQAKAWVPVGSSTLQLDGLEANKTYELLVSDMQGRLVKRWRLAGQTKQVIHQLQVGAFIYQIKSNDQTTRSGKLIVQ